MQPVNRVLQRSLWPRPSRLWILAILLVGLLLSGCVKAELGINYKGQSGGEIVQRIELAEPFTTFNRATAQQWFDQIKRRARQLQGHTKQSGQEIEVTIPFSSGADLETKLNQFLADLFAAAQPTNSNSQARSPLIQSHLRLRQQNFLLLLRNQLSYDLDLRSLGVQSIGGDLLLSPDPLIHLEFGLNTPWGARSVLSQTNDQTNHSASSSLGVPQAGRYLVWTLQPGQLNHLEAIFWFPSPLGVGAVAIALLVAGGQYLKYSSSPAVSVDASLPHS